MPFTPDDAIAIRRILREGVAEVGRRLSQAEPLITDQDAIREVSSVLSAAAWPAADYHVRRDLEREKTRAGAWRFDLVVEVPDRVIAVIDVRSGERGLEGVDSALSRLGLARSRGIAETAFLFAVGPMGSATGTGPPSIGEASVAMDGEADWRLRLYEAVPAPDA
jgi:hypothetical protein